LLKPVSRDTLTRQATETIKRFILTENLASGSQLPSERELSEILAVSRNIVRAALSVLMAEGIITKRAGKGAFVAEFDHSRVSLALPLTVGQNGPSARALREARAALEIGAVGLMVQRITPAEIEQLVTILETYERRHLEGKSTIKEDIEFHLALLRATKNEVIAEMAPLVIEVFRQTLAQEPSAIRRNPDRIIVEHRRILQALQQGDIAEARQAMHDHFRLQDFPV
jgi:DNA-binding FadR family transcriptional regulator